MTDNMGNIADDLETYVIEVGTVQLDMIRFLRLYKRFSMQSMSIYYDLPKPKIYEIVCMLKDEDEIPDYVYAVIRPWWKPLNEELHELMIFVGKDKYGADFNDINEDGHDLNGLDLRKHNLEGLELKE